MWDWIQRGGPVMYPLLLCSVVSMAFIIERFLFWAIDMRGSDSDEADKMLDFLRQGKTKEFLKASQSTKNPICLTLTRALSHGEETLTESLSLEIDATVEKTLRSLNVMDTCVTLAPLLGIFGTVTGIIQAFDILGTTAMADPHAASIGIAQALITTAAGLMIAMPSLIFFNYFTSKSEHFTYRLEKYAREFDILYKRAHDNLKGTGSSQARLK